MGPRPKNFSYFHNQFTQFKQNNVGIAKNFNKQLGNSFLQNQEGSCTFESHVHDAPSQYKCLHSGTLHTHQQE